MARPRIEEFVWGPWAVQTEKGDFIVYDGTLLDIERRFPTAVCPTRIDEKDIPELEAMGFEVRKDRTP